MDFSIMMWIWLAVIAVAAFIEAFTLQMASIWFVPGGLVALIMYFCGVGYEWQIVACIVISLVLLLSLRSFCLKVLFKNKVEDKTNTDSLIGMSTLLIKAITEHEKGEVRLNGVIWTAISADNTPIPAKTKVTITEIRGNKLLVAPAE